MKAGRISQTIDKAYSNWTLLENPHVAFGVSSRKNPHTLDGGGSLALARLRRRLQRWPGALTVPYKLTVVSVDTFPTGA